MPLSLEEQKKRLEDLLNEYEEFSWKENKGYRYPVKKPLVKSGSLWFRITKSNESLAISVSGQVNTVMGAALEKLIGKPTDISNSQRDWLNISFSKAEIIANLFDETTF